MEWGRGAEPVGAGAVEVVEAIVKYWVGNWQWAGPGRVEGQQRQNDARPGRASLLEGQDGDKSPAGGTRGWSRERVYMWGLILQRVGELRSDKDGQGRLPGNDNKEEQRQQQQAAVAASRRRMGREE